MNNKQVRIDPDFDGWLEGLSIERIKNGLEKEQISQRELTRMIMNTESRIPLEEELLTKKRKNE